MYFCPIFPSTVQSSHILFDFFIIFVIFFFLTFTLLADPPKPGNPRIARKRRWKKSQETPVSAGRHAPLPLFTMLLWTSSMDRSQGLQSGCWPVILLHLRIVQLFLQSSIKLDLSSKNMDAPFSQNSEKPARNHFPKMLQPVRNHQQKSHGNFRRRREVMAAWSGAASSMPRIQSRKAVTCNVRCHRQRLMDGQQKLPGEFFGPLIVNTLAWNNKIGPQFYFVGF